MALLTPQTLSTDGELSRYQLQVLVDDLNYFPPYGGAAGAFRLGKIGCRKRRR